MKLVKRTAGDSFASLPAGPAVISGWLVFANVYALHDHSQLPGAFFAILIVAVLLAEGEAALPKARGRAVNAALLLALPVLLLSGESKRALALRPEDAAPGLTRLGLRAHWLLLPRAE